MNDFNPGPGWREVEYGADAEGRESLHWKETGLFGGQDRLWVREEPVPPLPTEPYTVIRVEWKDEQAAPLRGITSSVLTLSDRGNWSNLLMEIRAERMDLRYTNFEVLSEPRAVTAKAVLDRVQQLTVDADGERAWSVVAHEFGVEL